MLLEQARDWTTIDAYVTRRPSWLALMLARVEWLWLEWKAGAESRRKRREFAFLSAAGRDLPEAVRRDIGLM